MLKIKILKLISFHLKSKNIFIIDKTCKRNDMNRAVQILMVVVYCFRFQFKFLCNYGFNFYVFFH